MRFLTLDFETYWSQDYTLTKLGQEDYITHPLFEIILVGVKINNDPPVWVTGTEAQIGQYLHSLDIENCALLCHHTMFDALILAIRFGITAQMYLDTRLLAQAALKPFIRSASLDSCLKHLDLGIQKGDAVHKYKGYRRDMFTRVELQEYAAYCMDDCEGTFRLFKYLAPQFSKAELEIIDITLRMYLQPTLLLDATLLAELLQEVQSQKAQVLNALPAHIGKDKLMSNPKFAEVLRTYGIEPPVKISPVTGLAAFAFNKTDTAWKELEDEWADDPVVSAVLAARISAKSTIEESRVQRLLEIALHHPYFRVPLLYYAAHTGRYGGAEKINIQNFPRVNRSRIRYAVRAPKDHVIIGADLKQIEARITAWLAKQRDLLDAFRNNVDIYAEFATAAFRIDTVQGRSKEDDFRRFVGKTCILGLGFGMGVPKLKATLRKDGLKFELNEVQVFVDVYRGKYHRIPMLWRALDNAIEHMAMGMVKISFGPVVLAKNSIILPNGMAIVYHNLRRIETDKYTGWVYDFAGETRTLWGGKITENVVQALARILIMEYMLRIKHTLGMIPAMQVHDELNYVVHIRHAEKVKAVLEKILTVPPAWALDLPVAVDVHYGPTFGDCK